MATGFEWLYTIDPIWYVVSFTLLVFLIVFFDRIQSSILKHELWRSHRPPNIFLVNKGELKKVEEITLTEKKEEKIKDNITTERGKEIPIDIHVIRDSLLVKFTDGTKDTIPLSDIHPYAINSIAGGWDASRIFAVSKNPDAEQYIALISHLKCENATLREENKKLAKASLDAVLEMADSIGVIAKKVRPTMTIQTGRQPQNYPVSTGGEE